MNYSFIFLLLLTSNLNTFIQCISLNYQSESGKTDYFQTILKQKPLPISDHLTNKEKQQVIKEAFLFAWEGYVEHSFGYDENRPVSNGPLNTRNGWGATIVDSLDTLYIMGLKDEFDMAKSHVANIQWDQVTDEVPCTEILKQI